MERKFTTPWSRMVRVKTIQLETFLTIKTEDGRQLDAVISHAELALLIEMLQDAQDEHTKAA